MKTAVKEFFIGFLYTFSNDKRGNSARKTTAFALMICVAWIHYKYIDKGNAINALWIDLLFVALMLGLVTAANIIEFYLGKKSDKNENPDSN